MKEKIAMSELAAKVDCAYSSDASSESSEEDFFDTIENGSRKQV